MQRFSLKPHQYFSPKNLIQNILFIFILAMNPTKKFSKPVLLINITWKYYLISENE